MPPEALRCKECKTNTRSRHGTCASSASDPWRFATPREPSWRCRAERRIQAGPFSIWRYADFLPVEHPQSALGARWTPLVRARRLAEELGIGELWIKNDAANPTHSFKDRVVSSRLRAPRSSASRRSPVRPRQPRERRAAHAAAAGLESYVFIPSDLEEQKVLATGIYGTNLVAVNGNYDDVNSCARRSRTTTTGRS